MIRAVFFDVGGTMIEASPSVGDVYARVGRQFGIDATAAAMEQAFRQAWKLSKRNGALTSSDKEWWRGLVAQALRLQGVADRPGYFEALYEEFTLPANWRVFPEVIPALETCRARGVHVGLISNWDERLRPLLARLDLLRYFDSVTISCEVGAEKPDRRIFEQALRTAGVPAGHALHLGDSQSEDCDGARALGLQARLVEGGRVAAHIPGAFAP